MGLRGLFHQKNPNEVTCDLTLNRSIFIAIYFSFLTVCRTNWSLVKQLIFSLWFLSVLDLELSLVFSTNLILFYFS